MEAAAESWGPPEKFPENFRRFVEDHTDYA
jgi:hypothetical protein